MRARLTSPLNSQGHVPDTVVGTQKTFVPCMLGLRSYCLAAPTYPTRTQVPTSKATGLPKAQKNPRKKPHSLSTQVLLLLGQEVG